jgi:hypothetical protein
MYLVFSFICSLSLFIFIPVCFFPFFFMVLFHTPIVRCVLTSKLDGGHLILLCSTGPCLLTNRHRPSFKFISVRPTIKLQELRTVRWPNKELCIVP